ncbi:PREDICTED: zinc transporter 6-like [Poecilia mexicana]|uniref:zinc transporter 6-like n=1 Tax=Poecilia mexicana TaxID=48701 RepID=UPI00072E38AB|nr:PREDICTED: zinc transporter 6-like [Poecilia mexicana]
MSVYSGKVLLQTTPSHIIGQLDKLLREVSTLDGVLEVRNEHFWTVGFGSLAGSAHVRIRRDANEQLVLAHVTNRLLPLVTTLTVQIFKDDWTRPLLSGVLSSPAAAPPLPVAPEGYAASFPPVLYGSAGGQEFDPLTSTPSKPSSPPPEFSFNTPGRNVAPLVLPAPGQHTHRPYGGLGLSYGAPPYAGMLGAGPGAGRGLAVPGLGAGFGLPSSHSYRTAFVGSTPPLRFGTSNPAAPQSQYRHYQP